MSVPDVPVAKTAKRSDKKPASATIGCETELWQMADALRGSTDAAELKHVVFGLILTGRGKFLFSAGSLDTLNGSDFVVRSHDVR